MQIKCPSNLAPIPPYNELVHSSGRQCRVPHAHPVSSRASTSRGRGRSDKSPSKEQRSSTGGEKAVNFSYNQAKYVLLLSQKQVNSLINSVCLSHLLVHMQTNTKLCFILLPLFT